MGPDAPGPVLDLCRPQRPAVASRRRVHSGDARFQANVSANATQVPSGEHRFDLVKMTSGSATPIRVETGGTAIPVHVGANGMVPQSHGREDGHPDGIFRSDFAFGTSRTPAAA